MPDRETKETTPSDSEVRIALLEHFRQRYALHRETSDRWFSYYLLIIAAPVPLLAALLSAQGSLAAITQHPATVATIALLFFLVGLLFLWMQTRQRANSVRLLLAIFQLEAPLLAQLATPADILPRRPNRFGADFVLALIHSVVNSIWLGGALYLLTSELWVALIAVLGAVFAQMVARHHYLSTAMHKCAPNMGEFLASICRSNQEQTYARLYLAILKLPPHSTDRRLLAAQWRQYHDRQATRPSALPRPRGALSAARQEHSPPGVDLPRRAGRLGGPSLRRLGGPLLPRPPRAGDGGKETASMKVLFGGYVSKFGLGLTLGLACCLMLMVTAAAIASASVPIIIYVSASDPTCAGHTPCYTNVQAAVTAAPIGSTIRVAIGTYTDPDTGSLGYLVWVNKSVQLQGGWNLAFTGRDADAYPTVLDAQGLGRVVAIYNATTVVFPVIEGFVMQGGNATGRGNCGYAPADCGGGIYSSGASPLIAGNVITGNVATTDPDSMGLGGGVYLYGSFVPVTATLRANTIENNVAYQATGYREGDGAGVCILDVNGAVLDGNQVKGNSADKGGGVYMDASDATLLTENVITENEADQGGGVYIWFSDGPTLLGNTVSGNTSAGLYFFESDEVLLDGNSLQGNGASGAWIQGSAVTVTGNLISGNGAGPGYEAALDIGGTPTLIENNTISENIDGGVRVSSGAATAAIIRGNTIASNLSTGLYLNGPATVQSNTIISNTSGGNSGGVELWYGDGSVFDDNVIAGNQSVGYGGGIHIQGGSYVLLTHNTVTGNSADGGGGLFFMDSQVCTVRWNVVSYNQSSSDGGGVRAHGASFTAFSQNSIVHNRASSGGGVYLYHSGTLTANDISNNEAEVGGGVYAYDGSWLTRNRIAGNIATAQGGGLYQERGVSFLRGNLFAGNQAATGGAVYMDVGFDSDGTIEGNTVIDNVASGDGGGLFLSFRGTLSLTNNVLADNSAAAHGDQLYIYAGYWPSLVASLRHNTFADQAGGDEAIYVGNYATVWMTNTLVVSHTIGIVEDGTDSSVQADYTLFATNAVNYLGDVSSSHEVTGTPGFVDPARRDYHLTSASDAIDAGIDAGVYTDIDGGLRPGGPGYDIGADEWWLRVILPIIVKQYLP